MPFVTSFYSNYDSTNIVNLVRTFFNKFSNERLKNVFGDTKFVHALRQPSNF